MPYTTVVAGTTITASWGNSVRDQLVTPFASAAARSSAVPSPPTGFASYLSDTREFGLYDGTNHVPSQDMYMGATNRTSNVTATTTETLLESVTFTVLAGRRYKYTYSASGQSSAAGDNYELRVRYAAGASVTSAGTQIHGALVSGTAAGSAIPIAFTKPHAGLPLGQVTLGVFVIRTFGAGTITASASAVNPTCLLIEDMGV